MRRRYHGEAVIFAAAISPGSILAPDLHASPGTLSLILDPALVAPTPHAFPNAASDPQYIPRPDGGHNSGPYNTDFFGIQFRGYHAIDSGGGSSELLWLLHPRYLRQVPDVFADFKYTRSFFDAALAATPFSPDPFKQPNGNAFSPVGISVPIQNPFNPFTVADTTLPAGTPFAGIPVTTGVSFRAINDTAVRTSQHYLTRHAFRRRT